MTCSSGVEEEVSVVLTEASVGTVVDTPKTTKCFNDGSI